MTPTEQAEAANFLAQLATIPGFDHPDLHRWVAALRAAPQAAPSPPHRRSPAMADYTELRAALAERDALPPLGNMATPSERVRHLSESNHANLGFMLAAVNAAPELLRERNAHKQASELSAAALRGVSEELARVTADARALKETLHDEMAENLRLRELGGAKPDENITAMTERVIAERDALAAKVQEMTLQALTDSGQWIEHTGELAAKVKALEADADRYRWLRDKSVPPHNFYLSVPIEFDGVRYLPAEVDAAIDAARGEQA